jgi:chromosome segregation ATPase
MNPRTALILAGLALVVGVVGLVIGISAKNGNKSDQDIADATKAQLEQQLGTTASQVQGTEQQQASKEAGVTAGVDRQLRALRMSVTQAQNNIIQLDDSKVMQANQIKSLQDDVNKLDTRVSNLEAK